MNEMKVDIIKVIFLQKIYFEFSFFSFDETFIIQTNLHVRFIGPDRNIW